MSVGRNVAPVGNHGNAWSAAAVNNNDVSAIVDTWSCPFVTVFGNSSGANTLTVQGSQDGTNFYALATIAANGDFAANYTVAARFIRLKSGAATTVTATVGAKG